MGQDSGERDAGDDSGASAGDRGAGAYWQANLRVVARCLVIWFLASYGCGILFADFLNGFRVAGFPVGFWFAQQGAIWVFLGLIWYYARAMNRLDHAFDVDDDDDADAS
ncbi:MAG TPA: DUF4212 domain-containing protein [Pseudomonadales bacterium]|nr:DUF4212 domain-containing protein [Pseudomonadales bacterium]